MATYATQDEPAFVLQGPTGQWCVFRRFKGRRFAVTVATGFATRAEAEQARRALTMADAPPASVDG